MTGGASPSSSRWMLPSATASRFAWLSTQPLGRPVVAGRVDDRRRIVRVGGRLAATGHAAPGAAQLVERDRTVGRLRRCTTTCRSAGSSPRTRASLAACSASSTNTTLASGVAEHVGALLGRVGRVDGHDDRAGTQRAEVARAPIPGGSRPGCPTRSPAPTPSAASPPAISVHRDPQVGVGDRRPARHAQGDRLWRAAGTDRRALRRPAMNVGERASCRTPEVCVERRRQRFEQPGNWLRSCRAARAAARAAWNGRGVQRELALRRSAGPASETESRPARGRARARAAPRAAPRRRSSRACGPRRRRSRRRRRRRARRKVASTITPPPPRTVAFGALRQLRVHGAALGIAVGGRRRRIRTGRRRRGTCGSGPS